MKNARHDGENPLRVSTGWRGAATHAAERGRQGLAAEPIAAGPNGRGTSYPGIPLAQTEFALKR